MKTYTTVLVLAVVAMAAVAAALDYDTDRDVVEDYNSAWAKKALDRANLVERYYRSLLARDHFPVDEADALRADSDHDKRGAGATFRLKKFKGSGFRL